jgi:hypothetical protein
MSSQASLKIPFNSFTSSKILSSCIFLLFICSLGSDILLFLFSTFNSIKESFNGKVLFWSPSISGRINAIDQIIDQNKVTIKEASDALKRSKEEERVVSDELSHTQEIDNKFKSVH